MSSGFLCIDKPTDVTSRDVVNVVQKLVRPLKVGHAGTLDPLATGVLVVAVGSATRLISYVQDSRKQYRGRFRLGLSSDTDDITGEVVTSGDPSPVTAEQLEALMTEFVGRIEQTPPQFSAVHVQGQRAYDLARKGLDVELTPRTVDVFSIKLVETANPDFVIDVTCGSGTYLRALGRDIGQRLGCGAVMTELRRTAIGPFAIDRAIAVDTLTRDNWAAQLWPLTTAVQHLAARRLSIDEVVAVRCGRTIPCDASHQPGETEISLVDAAGALVGVGFSDLQAGRLQPRLILAADERG